MNDQGKSDTSERVQKAVTFLNQILPTNGWRAAFVAKQRRKFNVFFQTNTELATYIIEEDARGSSVYHACASFIENTKRTHANVQALKTFLCDADCGSGKPFPDVLTAGQAIVAFCQKIQIPTPMFVGSGYGLHGYWPLTEEIDGPTWEQYARGFKALCAQHKLAVDPSRTADMASILRTPGTHNRKAEPIEVRCGNPVGPFPLNRFDIFLDAAPAPRQINGTPSLSNDLLGGIYGNRPSDPELVAAKCRQIGRIKIDPGKITEPLYHAITGVVVHCTDGQAFLHRYTSEEWHTVVDEKFSRAEAFGHPTTCEHFRSLNPQGCEGCPFSGHITTPLELGRMERPDNGGSTSAQSAEATLELHGEAIRLPPPDFRYNENGSLQLIGSNKNGAPTYDLVCHFPTYLRSVQTGELDGSQFSYAFRTYTPHDGWNDVITPAQRAMGRDAKAYLAGKGVVIQQVEAFQHYLREAAKDFHMNNVVEMRYDQFGWKGEGDAFLVGRRLYTPNGIKMVNGNETLQQRSQYLDFPKPRNASLERWQRAANKMFAEGLEHQSLAILCGFAAPLMRFLAEGEGGAIVSFTSDKTGSGKTTALEAAASIWGQHRGIKLDDTDTRVAKGLKLGILGNLPCTFDELHERDPEEVRKFVLIFTNGVDKDRGTIEGGLRVNKADWQTILLLASNRSIVDILINCGGSDAMAARVFEINTTLPDHTRKDDFEQIRRELAHNYGFAGDVYMKTLIQPDVMNWVRRKIPEATAFVQKEADLENKHRFWIRMIVSVIIAGTIVQKIGLLDFSVERIRDWLFKVARRQRDQVVGTTDDEAGDALGEFIHSYFGNTLVVDKTYTAGKRVLIERPPIGKLFLRYETEPQRLYIAEKELKKWLSDRAINVRAFVDDLAQKGVIMAEGRKHTLGAGTNFASHQVPCYVINMAHPAVTGYPVIAEKAYPKELPPES